MRHLRLIEPHQIVPQALARTLKLRLSEITSWDIRSRADRRGSRCTLAITVTTDRDRARDLQDRVAGSLVIRAIEASLSAYQTYGCLVAVEILIDMCHGKETQHIFKALYQQMTVRGKPTKRRK